MRSDDVLLFFLYSIVEVLDVALWEVNLAMLGDSFSHFSVNLLHCESEILWWLSAVLENSAIILVSVSGVPK
jgi:hypothetical protein